MAVDLGKTTDGRQDRDSIVIVNYLDGIVGGKVLDNTGFAPTTIEAGHIAIKEIATGTYKPLGVSGKKFVALPSGHSFEGIVVNTMPANKAMCGIMYAGTVNEKAMPYSIEDVKADLDLALKNINFRSDLA